MRAHRFATDHGKWRGRGKGQVKVFWNKRRGLGKLIFIDDKHQKIRLKQWVNGEEHCQHPPMGNAINSNNSAPTINSEKVEWFGTDYTMDEPMIGRWQLNFMDNRDSEEHFVRVFDDHIDGANRVSGGAVNDTVGLHVDEEENQQDDTKQFAFDHKAELRWSLRSPTRRRAALAISLVPVPGAVVLEEAEWREMTKRRTPHI